VLSLTDSNVLTWHCGIALTLTHPPAADHPLTVATFADDSALQTAQRTAFWSQSSRAVAAQREKLRAALEELYATSSNLASYVEQNRTGFRKILKKHDKLVSVSAALQHSFQQVTSGSRRKHG
jgi:SPX domain protein involved in polyphosphate accumulation